MKSRGKIFAFVLFLALAVSAGVLADLGGSSSGDNNLAVVRKVPPGSGCVCPAIWDPVVCTQPTRQAYSNICVATCNGASSCAHVAIPGP